MHRTRSARGLTIAVTGLLVTLAPLSSAIASPDSPETVSRLIAKVAPNQGAVARVSARAGGVAATVGDLTVTIPTNPNGAVVINDTDPSRPALEVHLPKELQVDRGNATDDGTVVYKGRNGVDAAVQVLADGSVRAQTITNSPQAAHRFTYTFGDNVMVTESPDGKVYLGKIQNDGQVAVAEVDNAWAVDANGASVPTHYEVQDDALVQVVDASADTAYPVVSDPRWRWWSLAWSAKMNKPETRDFANAGGGAAVCGVFGKYGLPSIGFCAAYWGYISAQANIARGEKNCIVITVTPPPLVFRYRDSDCFGSY
jgi:hypothetical protein